MSFISGIGIVYEKFSLDYLAGFCDTDALATAAELWA